MRLTPFILQATQIDRGFEWMQQQLEQLLDAITEAQRLGVEVKLNTVFANSQDAPRVREVLNWARCANSSANNERAFKRVDIQRRH